METLESLIVFKGLHEETMDHFKIRLRQVFDGYVSHRRRSDIEVPEFPDSCSNTAPMISELEDLIK